MRRYASACVTLAVIVWATPPQPASAQSASAKEVVPPVTAPPESFFEKYREGPDRDLARKFYKKTLAIKGLTVAAHGDVADEALVRTHEIVTHLLVNRPDVLDVMSKTGTKLIIIGKDQVYTDMPEYRNSRNPEYQNERVRGTGGLGVTSFGEENLLNLAGDRYDDESIGLHEFCHTIDAALRRADPAFSERLRTVYQNSVRTKGLWKYAYAASNQGEYWAEICQSYFDCNRPNNWNHNSVISREQLKEYDPEAYELIKATFRLTPETDWRLRPVRVQPSVVAPPAKFKVDPYYTKFSFGREFPIIGSPKVSDEAMLAANDTVRKMFAYRHDILKAMIADGAKLLVLGKNEKLSDLPEFKEAKTKPGFDEVRFLNYTPELKLMVVPEENVLNQPGDPLDRKSTVVAAFARGLYTVCGLRPADPNFGKGQPQQYELRVKRLDTSFDEKVKAAFDAAKGKKLWVGTPAAQDRFDYWTAGVLAYFDAAGNAYPPTDTDRPITTREALKAYDPELYALVDTTMTYREHQDWRFKPYSPKK